MLNAPSANKKYFVDYLSYHENYILYSLHHRKCKARYRVPVIRVPQNEVVLALCGYRVMRTALCGVYVYIYIYIYMYLHIYNDGNICADLCIIIACIIYPLYTVSDCQLVVNIYVHCVNCVLQ